MLIVAALLTLAPGAQDVVRGEWYDCLERYAQVAMLSTATPWEVAKDALLACSDERKAYQLALLRQEPENGRAEDGPSFADRLAEDDRTAAMRVVAFVNQNRRRP